VAFLARAIGYLIASVIVITALRSILGFLMKGVAEMFGGGRPAAQNRTSGPGMGGELKKDPVCGTFVSPSTAVQKTIGAETYYFCSPECRDKHRA
jgi:YHS domain-containing protein